MIKVPAEIWSRVVGFYRPVREWNKGKQSEYLERKSFDTKQIITTQKV